MTEATQESTPKPRRKLTEEQKAKMKAGRERAAEAKRRREAAATATEREPESPRLVKTNSSAIRDAQHRGSNGTGGLEDVAQRHVARAAGLRDAPPADEEDDYDEGSGYHGLNDVVPAAAVRPEYRDRPTVSVRDDGDDAIMYIPDIMREWGAALNAGTCYIRVERKRPSSQDGLSIKGLQKPIRQAISEDEFVDIYGGGVYELVVYGPTQRGHRVTFDGRTQYRRLSKVITITIPNNFPPNIDAVVDEQDEDMQASSMGYQGVRGVRRTNADAHVHKTDLEFREREILRTRDDNDRRIQEERERADQISRESASALREMRQSHETAMQMLRENNQVQLDMMTRQMEAMEKRFQDNQSALAKKPTESELVVDFAKAQLNANSSSPETIARIEQNAAASREQLMSQHRDELRHLRDDHSKEVERLHRQIEEERRRADDRIEQARKAIDDRINEIQRQADNRVSEAEKRAEREIKYVKEESERRVRDIESSYKQRIEDLDRSHERDLRSKDDSHTTRKESLENTHKTEMAAKDAELSRLRDENERLREENKKPLGERIQEFTESAEMMGFTKGDGNEEKDWKSTLVETGMGVLGQLPQIVQSVSSTLQSRQRPPQQALAGLPMTAPQQLPPPVQGRGGGIAAARDYGGWATEDGPSLGDETSWRAEPEVPGEVPDGPTLRPHFAGNSSDIAQPPPRSPAPAPAPAPRPSPQPTTPLQPARANQQIMQANPAAPAEPQPIAITDAQILQYSQGLSAAVEQGATPREYYEVVSQQWGDDMVHAITNQITLERITEVLERHDDTNPLLRRDGQKFLQELWALAARQ